MEKMIQNVDAKCLNNIAISEKIREIPFFYHFFNPIVKHKMIGEAVIVDDVIDMRDYDKLEKDYKDVLIWKNSKELTEFHVFFMNLREPRDIVVYIIDSYKELLENIAVLRKNKICYFDLKMDKIFFDKFEKPILTDFEEAIHYNNIKFLNCYIPNYYIWPLEVNVIHYLKYHENIKSLSKTNIEQICKDFIIKNKALAFFPESHIVSYYKKCVESLLKFINIPKADIITELCKGIDTWDNYSLSIIYLQLLYILRMSMSDIVANSCGFFTFFSRHLFYQLDPFIEKRPNIIETQNNFNNIFKENIDWFYLSSNMDNREILSKFSGFLIDNINHVNQIIMDCEDN